MADHGVAVTWGSAKAGRERKALELWADAVTTNEKAVANGLIERWDAVVFEPAPGGPGGVIRIYGTRDQVNGFIESDDFSEQVMRSQVLLDGVGLRRFVTGGALMDEFAQYAQLVESL